jgi:hypothetical protein
MTTLGVEINASVVPQETEGSVPGGLTFPAALSAQAGKLQYVTLDPTTGRASAAADNVPHQIAAGYVYPDEATTTDASNADNAVFRTSQRPALHLSPSTGASDSFAATDVGTAWWIADTETPGKLSHTGTTFASTLKNRTLGGLVLGLVAKGRTAIRHWGGPIAQAIARGVLMADNASAGSVAYPVDSGATVDVGSTSAATSAILMPRTKTHGLITSIEIIPSAALSATSGNDRTITIWKIDTLGVNAAVSVGTFTTTTALVAQTVATFTLSTVAGALHMLETDILGYSTVHASSGAIIPQSAIRANMKVI